MYRSLCSLHPAYVVRREGNIFSLSVCPPGGYSADLYGAGGTQPTCTGGTHLTCTGVGTQSTCMGGTQVGGAQLGVPPLDRAAEGAIAA